MDITRKSKHEANIPKVSEDSEKISRPLSYRALQAFRNTFIESSYSNAGHNMRLDRRGVLKLIADLEADLGVPLFLKEKQNRVSPSEFGGAPLRGTPRARIGSGVLPHKSDLDPCSSTHITCRRITFGLPFHTFSLDFLQTVSTQILSRVLSIRSDPQRSSQISRFWRGRLAFRLRAF